MAYKLIPRNRVCEQKEPRNHICNPRCKNSRRPFKPSPSGRLAKVEPAPLVMKANVNMSNCIHYEHVAHSHQQSARGTLHDLAVQQRFLAQPGYTANCKAIVELPEFTHLAQEPAQRRPSKVQNLARLADGQVHASEKKNVAPSYH